MGSSAATQSTTEMTKTAAALNGRMDRSLTRKDTHFNMALKLVTITTNGGQKFVVAELYAPNFLGLLNELEATGYKVKSAGGYNNRNIRGRSRKSVHSWGGAIDINAEENPRNEKLITN